tara:strand:- start:2283 stop:2462 length:180 start_codon:yes stop_codon:yes gene_type:complete
MGFHFSEKPARIKGLEPPVYDRGHGWIYYSPKDGEYYDSTTDMFVYPEFNNIVEALTYE